MKTLNERVLEAKAMASLSKVESRDKHGRARTVLVPASEATLNQVIIRRFNNGIITTECRKQVGKAGYVDCAGNHNGVCRHSLAAIFKSLSEQGYTPRFRRDYEDAAKFGLMHSLVSFTNPDNGRPIIFSLTSHQGKHAQLYFVAIEDSATEPVVKKQVELSWMGVSLEEDAVISLAKEIQRIGTESEEAGYIGQQD